MTLAYRASQIRYLIPPNIAFLLSVWGWKHTLSRSKRSGDLPRGTSLSEALQQQKETFLCLVVTKKEVSGKGQR